MLTKEKFDSAGEAGKVKCQLDSNLFSSKIFCKIDAVVLSFVFDKCYPVID
jgi:hypothetical protein